MPAAVLFGCAGPRLGTEERAFFRRVNPLGFILFARNIETAPQVRKLVSALRESVGRSDAPVLIDQEGGRVARLKPPIAWGAPPAAAIGALAQRDAVAAERAAFLSARLTAADLAGLGITVDCAPVADLRWPGAHEVIGDRAYSDDPGVVARLAVAACDGFLAGGVTPVFKHVPGHGRARSDSHHELPRIEADLDSLQRTDFAPFRELAARHGHSSWAMTAHIVVAAIDDEPVTLSKRALDQIVRAAIGFDGLIVSDDLSMQALSGGLRDRAAGALAAGCDLVLHCNGDPAEMASVADAAPELTAAARSRFDRAEAVRRSRALPCDPGLLKAEFDALLGQGGRPAA